MALCGIAQDVAVLPVRDFQWFLLFYREETYKNSLLPNYDALIFQVVVVRGRQAFE